MPPVEEELSRSARYLRDVRACTPSSPVTRSRKRYRAIPRVESEPEGTTEQDGAREKKGGTEGEVGGFVRVDE